MQYHFCPFLHKSPCHMLPDASRASGD
jgi:hypothetical protein